MMRTTQWNSSRRAGVAPFAPDADFSSPNAFSKASRAVSHGLRKVVGAANATERSMPAASIAFAVAASPDVPLVSWRTVAATSAASDG